MIKRRRRTLAEFLAERHVTEVAVQSDGAPPLGRVGGPFARPIQTGSHHPSAKANAARGVGFGRRG